MNEYAKQPDQPDQYLRDCLASGPWFRQIKLPLDLSLVDPRSMRNVNEMAERLVCLHNQTIVIVTDSKGWEVEWGVVNPDLPTYTLLCYRMVTIWRPPVRPTAPAPGCILYVSQDQIRRVE